MPNSARVQGQSSRPRAEVEEYLAGLPDVRRGADVFLYTDEEEDATVELRAVGDPGQVGYVDVVVPGPVSAPAAERLASFCRGLAGHLGWEVRDAGSGAPLGDAALRRRFAGGALAGRGCVGAVPLLCVVAALLIRLRS